MASEAQIRLLSLDQSSRNSGWAVFINGELKDSGLLTTTQDEIGKRLTVIRKFIIEKVQEWDINTIAFEDIQLQNSVGNNVKTFKVLANVYGVVLETAVELNKKVMIIASATWKSQLKIKGHNRAEQKKSAQYYVLDTYKLKVNQDTADAVCIGDCACRLIGLNNTDRGFDWSE